MKLKSEISVKINYNFHSGVKGYLSKLQCLGILLVCLFLSSCTGTRHLPKGERLYTGAVLKLESTEKLNTSQIKTVLKAAILPEPNSSYLGIRPQLWLYMAAGENPQSKFNLWLRKMGQAPVLMTNVSPTATAAVIDAQLFNLGIFNSNTTYKIIENKHTASVIYTCQIHKPYTIKEFVYTIDPLNSPNGELKSLSEIILADRRNSIIKPGENYKLDVLKAERIRIDALLKNNGYFYFNPDYLLFKADTSVVDNSISLELTLKDSVPNQALTVYRINKVFIDQNY